MNTTTPHKTIQQRLELLDLTLFAAKSGIPRRTLERIRGQADYPMSITTRLALENALKRFEARTQKKTGGA
jgi:hypothetical protein